MSRTVTIELKVRLLMKIDEGVEVGEVVNEMDYEFTPPDNTTLYDSEILDYEVKDSR